MILRSNLVELCNFTLDLDEILNLIESVSEDFPSYFCRNVECRVVDYIKKCVGFSRTSFLLPQVGKTLN